jgi:hypothetical protein
MLMHTGTAGGGWRASVVAVAGLGMALALAGCSGARGKPATPGQYTNQKDRFSIVSPPGWETKEAIMGVAVAFLEPYLGPSDDFRENLNVFVEKLPPSMDLDGYNNVSNANVEKLLTDFQRVQSDPVKLNGQDARRMVYRHRLGVFDLQVLSYLLVKDGRGYAITCSAKADAYKDHEPIFEQACQTFHAD